LTLRRNSKQQQQQQPQQPNNSNDGEGGGGGGRGRGRGGGDASTITSSFSASSDAAAVDAVAVEVNDEVVVFDRLRTLGNLGEAFPFKRLCGHGFSGPITDLHARLLLALLCARSLAGTENSVGTTEQGGWWVAPGNEVCSEVAAPESLPHWARTFH